MSEPDPGEQLRAELRDEMKAMLNFIPVNLGAKPPEGEPYGAATLLEMYDKGVSDMIAATGRAIMRRPEASRLEHIQNGYNGFAYVPFPASELAAMLAITFDTLARQDIAMRPATREERGEE